MSLLLFLLKHRTGQLNQTSSFSLDYLSGPYLLAHNSWNNGPLRKLLLVLIVNRSLDHMSSGVTFSRLFISKIQLARSLGLLLHFLSSNVRLSNVHIQHTAGDVRGRVSERAREEQFNQMAPALTALLWSSDWKPLPPNAASAIRLQPPSIYYTSNAECFPQEFLSTSEYWNTFSWSFASFLGHSRHVH